MAGYSSYLVKFPLIPMKKLLLLSTMLLAACGHSVSPVDPEAGPIKIGYIGPLTGDGATYGSDTVNGAQIKVDEINAAGGINGAQIEFIAEDGRCTGSDAASAAQKLINVDKVVAINGGVCSGETLAAAPIAEGAAIPLVSSTSTSPDVTGAGEFVFRVVPSDALAADATAQYLKQEGLNTIAIISENTDFAVALANSLTEKMGEENVVFAEIVEPGTKDFRTLVTRLKDIEFDAFVANGQTVAVSAAMLTQLHEQGIKKPTIGNNGIVSPTLGEIAGEAAEGLKVVLPPSKGANEKEFNAFASEFETRFGPAGSSMIYSALSYDVIGVLAEAIEKVGTDGEAIRTYLNDMKNYRGAAGTFSFDENGDVIGIPFDLQEVQNGEFITIKSIPLN